MKLIKLWRKSSTLFYVGLFLSQFVFLSGSLKASESLTISVPSNTTKVLHLEDFTAYSTIEVLTNNGTYKTLYHINHNLLDRIIVLTSQNQSTIFTINLNKRYKEGVELEYTSSLFNIDPLIISQERLAQFSNFNAGQLPLHFEEMTYSCSSDTLVEKLNNNSLILIAHQLLENEMFTSVIDFVKNSCLLNNHQWSKPDIVLMKIYLDTLIETMDFDTAMKLFPKVLDWFNQQNNSIANALAKHELLADYGFVSTLSGYFSNNNNTIQDGLEMLKLSHSFFMRENYEFSTIGTLADFWSYYATQGMYDDAFIAVNLSIDTLNKLAPSMVKQQSSNYMHKALTFKRTGHISNAIEITRETIKLSNTPDESLANTNTLMHINLASLYIQVGDFESAQNYLKYVEGAINEKVSDYARGVANDGLAVIYIHQKNWEKAKQHISIAFEWFKNYPHQIATLNLRLADVATQQKDFDTAIKHLNLANEHYLSAPVSFKTFDYYIRLGQLALAQKEKRKAIEILNSLNNFVDELPHISDLPDGTKPLFISQQLAYLQFRIDVFSLTNSALNNEQNILQMIELVRNISASLDPVRSGPIWNDYTNSLIAQYTNILYEDFLKEQNHKRLEQIFLLLENNSAFSVRLKRNQALLNEQTSLNYLQTIYQSELNTAEKAIIEATDENTKLKAKIAVDEAWEKYKLANEILPNREFVEQNVYGINQVKNKIRHDEIVLRYFYIKDNLFVFIIDAENWRIEEIGITRNELANLTTRLNPMEFNSTFENLNRLSKLIPSSILNKNSASKLIIVNTGLLHLVPFSALNTAKSGYTPLLEKFEITQPFHLSGYLDNQDEIITNQNKITIFADPIFKSAQDGSDTGYNFENQTKRNWFNGMKRLPATLVEAQSINQVFQNWDVNELFGKNATSKNLMSQSARDSTILHIASHGYFSESTPDVVGIATSVQDASGNSSEGFLSLRTILSANFRSQLVVVSGCQTALGRPLKGEGLTSLSRGLISQGAGGVISTLWEISDRSTATFMRIFYRQLIVEEGDIKKALRATQLKMLASGRYRNPKYWAPFIFTSTSRQSDILNVKNNNT